LEAGPEEQAAAKRAAAKAVLERRLAQRNLRLVVFVAGLAGAVIAVLIIINPAVEASIESKVPTGTIELVGNVTSKPVLAKLGAFELGWNPFGPQQAHPINAQSIVLKMPLSPVDCRRLAHVVGVCGGDPIPPVRHLESLRVAASERALRASLIASVAPRAELEPIGEIAHRGAPFEWSLRSYSPSLGVRLSCEHRIAVEVTSIFNRPGSAKRSHTVTCRPGGANYRVRILDTWQSVTNIGFQRVLQFHASATADQGAVTIGHGTLAIDDDSEPLDGPTLVALSSEHGSTLSSWVVSPNGNDPVEVELKAPRASHALVDADERTPNAFERIPIELRIAFLAPLLAGLVGVSGRAIRKLRPWERTDAKEE
jgi:hypothetical protein